MDKIYQFIVILVVADKIFTLPNDIEKCRINDEKCLLRSSNKVLRKYYGGITEIDLVPLEPFMVDKIKLNHNIGAIKTKGNVYNVMLQGFATTTIESISGFDKNLLEIDFKTPRFSFSGFYKATSEVLGFPIVSEGKFLMNFYDFAGKLKIKLERYTRNGKTYFRTNGYEISSTLRTGDVDWDGAGRSILWLVNASFDLVIKSTLKSYVGDLWTVYYEKAINRVLTKVPIEELFIVD
ncbi:circadian clock-controlled protein daywake-like [Chironomus tepperi]|uniref:circadian clock-controlled protein daywake-like n=1 Tax=Chironomus tepperi TaxID=113505 RepID=UPI00391F7ECF